MTKKLTIAAAAAAVGVLAYLLLDTSSNEPDVPAPPTPPAAAPSPTPNPSRQPTHPPTSTPTPGTPSNPTDQSHEEQTAEDSAQKGLTAIFTWYPAADSSPTVGYQRAREWVTDALAQRMGTQATTARGPGLQWEQWAAAGTQVIATDVRLECSGCPPDTDMQIQRVATIQQAAITDGETESVTPKTVVWITMVKQGDRWLIDAVDY